MLAAAAGWLPAQALGRADGGLVAPLAACNLLEWLSRESRAAAVSITVEQQTGRQLCVFLRRPQVCQ